MAHSNQVREFVLTSQGIRLAPVYIGSGSVLTGSARLSQEAREKADTLIRKQMADEKHRVVEQKRRAVEAQIAALRAELADEEARAELLAEQEAGREQTLRQDQDAMTALRRGGNNRRRDGNGLPGSAA